MLPLKPFVWLNETGTYPIIEIKVQCTSGQNNLILSQSGSGQSNGSSVFVITFTLSPGNTANPGGGIQNGAFDFANATNYSGQKKIIIRTVDPLDNLKGRTTVFLAQNPAHFITSPCKVFCYLKFINSAEVRQYIYVDFAGHQSINSLSTPPTINISNSPKYSLLYNGTNLQNPINEDNFLLNTGNNYDPSTYDQVEVSIMYSGRLEGKGTTTDSEADASGDDI